jgi:hypothetical protein
VENLKSVLRNAFWGSALLLAATGPARSQSAGHYLAGSSGINSAAIPQAREHSFKSLTGMYYASEYVPCDGGETSLDSNLDLLFGSIEYRFMSGRRLLGGNYGFAFKFIFAEADFNVTNPGIQDGPVGVGDPGVTPLLLGWRSGILHWMFDYSFFVPVGRYDEAAVDNVGKGHWSHLFSLGGNGRAGADSTWSGTLIARYEYNTKLEDRDLKPGDDVIVEAALGKRLWGAFDVGAVGYGVWQVTDHSGSAADTEGCGSRARIMAAGIELALIVPDQPVEIKWRTYGQFAARERYSGSESMLELYFYF